MNYAYVHHLLRGFRRDSTPKNFFAFCVLLGAFVVLMTGVARAQGEGQTSKQLWIAYDPAWKFNERWTFILECESRISGPDFPAQQMRLEPTLEFSLRKWIDLTGGLWLIYTNRAKLSDLFETRPSAGVRLKHDIWRGVRVSNHIRIEARILQDLDTGDTTPAWRLRNRTQALIPINHKSISEDNTWSALGDVEWFIERNPNVDDEFNSRRRYRAGLSWRKNGAWTYQFLYVFQRSGININQPLLTDHIFAFDLIHNIK